MQSALPRSFHCYVHGHGSQWEAICVNLDIAVTGRSLHEAKQTLTAAIKSYVEDARNEDPATAAALLNRPAPLRVRASLFLALKFYHLRKILSIKSDEKAAGFDIPCHA